VASQPGAAVELVPADGVAQLPVPETGQVQVFLTVDDPTGDDSGPGDYTYPTDPVFDPGVFDITQFQVARDEESLVFRFDLTGPLTNPWGSPNGLALQTLDVYIDTGEGGSRMLLPGRNAALSAADAWDIAVWVEGWEGGIYRAGEGGQPQSVDSDYMVLADTGQSRITLRVPKRALPDGDPTTWGYLAVVMSQDGFPAAGVWRIRDVDPEASQWRLGGAADDVNHTRIIDLVWPADAEPTQFGMLSDYPPSQAENIEALTPDDFAQLEMLMP
jgi:carbohydrate-binding DOMON domain-containing protein